MFLLVRNLFFVLLIFCTLPVPPAFAASKINKIYIQAGPGSFNDAAFSILKTTQHSLVRVRPVFAGTPTEAMMMATNLSDDSSGFVFVAVKNNLIGLVEPTIAAFQNYEALQVVSGIETNIEMCVLVLNDVASSAQLTHVASILPALDQVKLWRQRYGITAIAEPKGTSEAAKKLSQGDYPSHTGVIGPRQLVKIYPNLVPIQCGIEDKSSTTEFALLHVRPRVNAIDRTVARAELNRVVQQLQSQELNITTLQRLFLLVNQRLSFMKDVAAYKWVHREAIENKVQEELVLQSIRVTAHKLGMNENDVENFFRLQIEISKHVQNKWHRHWKNKGFSNDQKFADLKTTVRPQLQKISEELVRCYQMAEPMLRDSKNQVAIKTLLRETLTTPYVSNRAKNKLVRFLVSPQS